MDLVTHIFECLDELNEAVENDFVMGEKYAYIECLEILLQDKGIKNETMLAPDKCLKYGFCDIIGVGEKKGDDETERLEDNLEDNPDEDRDEGDDPDDDKEQQIKELQQQLYRQRQINQMLTGLKRPSMQRTFAKALEQITNK